MKGAIAVILFGLLFGCAWDLENSPDSLLFKKVKKIEKKREENDVTYFLYTRI